MCHAPQAGDRLAHALIGLTKAVSEVRSGSAEAGRLPRHARGTSLDRAVAEADGVLASEQSAA